MQSTSDSRTLILGGCGYLGSALFKHLKATRPVASVDLEWFGNPGIPNERRDYGDLTTDELDAYDAVIVLASHSSVPMCRVDRLGAIDNNVRKLVALASKLRSQKFIYASSSCVYDGHTNEATEETPLIPPKDDLALTKYMIDAYAPNLGVEFYGLRLGSVGGPSPNTRTDLMVNRMNYDCKMLGSLRVSNASAFRPILAIPDFCGAIELILDAPDRRGIYNLCSYNDAIGDIAKEIGEYYGSRVVEQDSCPTFSFTMSSEKFENTFGWHPTYVNSRLLSELIDGATDVATMKLSDRLKPGTLP